jgi:hypothetical protein
MHNRYIKETNHERVMTQPGPTMCSCTKSLTDTRNIIHLYKPLFRSVSWEDVFGAEEFSIRVSDAPEKLHLELIVQYDPILCSSFNQEALNYLL